MTNDVTAIICAMEKEAGELIGRMVYATEETILGKKFVSGNLCGRSVVISVCGIGKVAAASCAQTMLLKYSPARVIDTGVGGALTDALFINDIVIADDVVQHDVDTTAFGDPPGYISGLGLVGIPCDEEMSKTLMSCAEALGIHSTLGRIATGDRFIDGSEAREKLVGLFGAVACDMEGAAIGQVCREAGVKFAVMRSISDGGDAGEYEIFVRNAVRLSSAVTMEYLNCIK